MNHRDPKIHAGGCGAREAGRVSVRRIHHGGQGHVSPFLWSPRQCQHAGGDDATAAGDAARARHVADRRSSSRRTADGGERASKAAADKQGGRQARRQASKAAGKQGQQGGEGADIMPSSPQQQGGEEEADLKVLEEN